MSYLMEMLGCGLLGELLSAFENQLPQCPEDDVRTLRKRRQDSPGCADLAVRHGMACLRDGLWAESKTAFEAGLELSDSPAQPALGLACVYDELGRLDETLRCLFLAHTHDPSDPAIVFAIAFCKERNGDADGAVDYYERAIALCPRLRNAFERLAAIAIRKRDLDEAARCYECLSQIEPGDIDVLMMLASLHLESGRSLEAIALFERALLIEPQSADGTIEEATELAEAGQITEAISKLQAFVKKYPGIPDFHVYLGDLHVKDGDDVSAMAEYEAALEIQPTYLEATVKLGTQHLRSGRYSEAAQAFNNAVELNDRLVTAYVGLGVAQDACGRTSESQATFDLAASLDPNSTLLFAETARLHLKAERTRRARDVIVGGADETEPENDELFRQQILQYEQALALWPGHADLYYRYGLLLRQVGAYERATEAFEDAVRINPCYVKAIIKLGICQRERGRTDEAVATFRSALKLQGDAVDAHYELGLLFAQRNQFELAVEAFEAGLEHNREDVAFRANLALSLQAIGMLDRAASTWRSICDLTRDVADCRTSDRAAFAGELEI